MSTPVSTNLLSGGRRNGRGQITRWRVLAAASSGQHTHILAADGTWCVIRQPAGYLWALVRHPGPRCHRCSLVIAPHPVPVRSHVPGGD